MRKNSKLKKGLLFLLLAFLAFLVNIPNISDWNGFKAFWRIYEWYLSFSTKARFIYDKQSIVFHFIRFNIYGTA